MMNGGSEEGIVFLIERLLLEDFKSHLDSLKLGGLVIVAVMLMAIVMEMLMTMIRMIMIIISTHSCWSHGCGCSGPAM